MSKNKITRDFSDVANDTYDLLNDMGLGVLATMNKDGTPHQTAIYYMVSEDFKIMFATKQKTRKHENMQRNSTVQLLSFDEQSQATVQLYGKAERVDDAVVTQEIVEDILWRLRDNQESTPPVAKLFAGNYVVYSIIPTTITTAIFMRPERVGQNLFQTLDFTQ